MGNGVIGKFIYFWIFLLGGLLAARLFGIADTAKNMILLSIALAVVYVVWNVLRAKGRQNTATQKSQPHTSQPRNKHKKKKK